MYYICHVLQYNYHLIFKIMFTCVILVNDLLIEKTLVESIGKFSSIEVIDILFDRVTAIERLNQLQPDILFVHTDDPQIGAIDITEIGNQPGVSFAVTNRDDSAHIAELLDKGYFDLFFLHKFNFEIFLQKINKMMKILYYLPHKKEFKKLEEKVISYAKEDSMFVKYNKSSVKVDFSDILYVRNEDHVLKIYLSNGRIVLHNSTLRKFIHILPRHQFLRINNAVIVNHERIEEFSRNSVTITGVVFPVTKSYIDALRRKLKI